MSTIPQFLNLLKAKASVVRYHRNSDAVIPCPCITPEGFRNPLWHLRWKSPINIAASGDIGGAPITATTVVAYRAFALSDDGGIGAAVGPPSEGASYVSGAGYNFTLYFNQTIRDWGYFLLARSIDNGPWKEIARIGSGSETYLDVTPIGSEARVIPEVIPTCTEEARVEVLPKDFIVKGFVQPIQSTRATRLNDEILQQMFGEIQTDDHLGILPCQWEGHSLDFRNWSQSGDEYIEYDGRQFLVVNANKIPDPDDGNPNHHWEVGLRLISEPLA